MKVETADLSGKREEFLAYGLPLIEEDDIAAVVEVLRSGWVTRGPRTASFEEAFAQYIGVKHAVALNSCTAALHLGLAAAGIGSGDEVITTPLTFVSTVNVILHTGAQPVFADIDPATLNLDPEAVASRITARTRAILPVHLAGIPCDMDALGALAEAHGLYILEDAAHGLCTRWQGKLVGSLGNTAAFSFYATKNLVTGEGGMLTTDDDAIAEKARLFSLHGMDKNAWKRYSQAGSWFYDVTTPGFKCNMTDIQAALGLTQLAKLERMQHRREAIAALYNDAFASLPEVSVPVTTPGGENAWHLYILKLNLDKLKYDRDKFIELLREENIGTSVHFIPVHMHSYYRETFGYVPEDFPQAETAYRRIISLPLYPKMTLKDAEHVAQAVRRVCEEARTC
jgi:dTDP-4-amino-4,6-dideoxygalactose transaminase